MNSDLTISEVQALAMAEFDDPQVVSIVFGGGAGGGKSFLIGLLAAIASKKYPKTRWGLARKELKSLKQTTLATLISKVHPALGISESDYKLNMLDSTLTYSNGSELLLLDLTAKPSDPEMESLGSLELTGAFVDEIGEVNKKAFDVLSSRVNRWMNKEYGITGKVVGSCNPSPGFVRQDYYDKYEKMGGGRIQRWQNEYVWVNGKRVPALYVYIRSTALDNPFVDENYIEGLRRLPPQEKKRLLEGDWNYLDEDDSLFTMALVDKMTVYELPEKEYNEDGDEIDENGKLKKFNKFIGCLPAGEMIPTDKGLKQIQNITVEDKLISDDGTLTDIVNTQKYEVENEPLFSIKISNSLRPVKLTGEHPVMASDLNIKQYWKNDGKYNYGEYCHNLDFKFTKAKDIRVGQFVRMPNIYSQVREMPTFTSIDRHGNTRNLLDLDIATKDQDFWWLVGLWLGDGWSGAKGSVSLAYNSNETAHIDKTKSILDRYGISYSLRKRGGSCIEIAISSRDLSDFLVANFGHKAGGKVIPEWAKYMSSEYKTALVSGYIDSDGSIYNSQKRINTEIVSINFELLESVQDMLFSLGIVSNVKKLREAKSDYVFPHRATPSITKEAYTLCMGTDASVKFARQSSQSIKISNMETINLKRAGRKRDCFIDNNYIYFRIKNIDESFISEPVYNFETTSHTFCAKNISTHNCDPSDKGKDDTVITLIDNGIICEQVEIKSPPGADDAIGFFIAGKLIQFAEKHGFTKLVAKNIILEENGIGASLRDAMRVLGWRVNTYMATLQSRNDGYYEFMVNADEGKIKILNTLVEQGPLLKQLTAHRYDTDTGKPRITPKKEIRKLLNRSPDHSDSAMIANLGYNKLRPKNISSYIRW